MERDPKYPPKADEPLIDRGIQRLERHRPAAPREGNAPTGGWEQPPRPRLAFPRRPETSVDEPVTSAIALEEAAEGDW